MSTRISTLALMAALVAVAVVSFPSEALAQYGYHHGYGHRYHGYGYGHGGYGLYGYGAYDAQDGAVRIEISPKVLRDDAQVYVNEAHVGTVNDFDGFFQRLTLTPGEYDIEIRLDGYQTLTMRVFVQVGGTYKIRESLKPLVAN